MTLNKSKKYNKKLNEYDKDIINEIRERRLFFENDLSNNESYENYTCPSCGFPTFTQAISWDICSICNWEDNGQDDYDADYIYDGPNKISLTQSRLKIGQELKLIADKVDGKIVNDLNDFLNILNHHNIKMKIIDDKIKDDTDINDPLWEEWIQTSESIKNNLIIK